MCDYDYTTVTFPTYIIHKTKHLGENHNIWINIKELLVW